MRNLPVCRYSVLLGYRRDCFFCSHHRDIVNPNQPKTIISRIAGEDEEEKKSVRKSKLRLAFLAVTSSASLSMEIDHRLCQNRYVLSLLAKMVNKNCYKEPM